MLEHFFGSRTRLKLMHIFFRSPERPFYVRELARLADIQLNAVRRELANLERVGIVKVVDANDIHRVAEPGTERSKYYGLATGSPLFPELKALLLKAQVVDEQELVKEIKERGGSIKLFILTGFFSAEPEANTDMLIVGSLKPLAIAKIIRDYEKETQRTVRYTLMDTTEFRERREIGDKFLYSIFESKHLTAVDEIRLT